MTLAIWTDGSCTAGYGGWAVYAPENLGDKILSGEKIGTTNNRMELTAIINALKLADGEAVIIFSDSQWAIHATDNSWKIKENLDLVKEARGLFSISKATLRWVKGHDISPQNKLADELAKTAAILCMKREMHNGT
mgnify:CR=1 FL=1